MEISEHFAPLYIKCLMCVNDKISGLHNFLLCDQYNYLWMQKHAQKRCITYTGAHSGGSTILRLDVAVLSPSIVNSLDFLTSSHRCLMSSFKEFLSYLVKTFP